MQRDSSKYIKSYSRPLTDMGELCECAGQDCFLLEPLFRNEAWGHMLAPMSEANERSVYVSMMEGCRAALQGYSTTIDDDLRALRDAPPGSRLEKAILVGVPASARCPPRSCACILDQVCIFSRTRCAVYLISAPARRCMACCYHVQ